MMGLLDEKPNQFDFYILRIRTIRLPTPGKLRTIENAGEEPQSIVNEDFQEYIFSDFREILNVLKVSCLGDFSF